jgi:hypothetical protein
MSSLTPTLGDTISLFLHSDLLMKRFELFATTGVISNRLRLMRYSTRPASCRRSMHTRTTHQWAHSRRPGPRSPTQSNPCRQRISAVNNRIGKNAKSYDKIILLSISKRNKAKIFDLQIPIFWLKWCYFCRTR